MKFDIVPDAALTRRGLLLGAGKTVLGAAALSALAGAVPGFTPTASALGGTTEKWPWPYVKLDPEKTAEIAYNEWYRVFCGAAVINSVFSQLREKVGEPYKSFPIDSFVFLEGGMAGWGTVCGSNAGANIVSNVIIGPRIAGPDCEHGHTIGSEMMQWYSETPLPGLHSQGAEAKGKDRTDDEQVSALPCFSGQMDAEIGIRAGQRRTKRPLRKGSRKRCV